MSDSYSMEKEEIYSKVMRAGRRTYFFDVRSTKAGDYYLTITESKKFTNDDGSFHYKKHKIYLYKEDFSEFKDHLSEMIDYIINEKGEEVISERHQSDYKKEDHTEGPQSATEAGTVLDEPAPSNFTDIDFDDI
ncbi:PUR family DNA/RNA-binding protein [Rasiella rasia]|uniref:PUR family DNA/RNA-binding protein n=1 Tax=Rasiella rasia TaxID=2744027 RepID=A0A6G6GK46_9FLAO|nr:PUR family DNA/RNA-binding protein [Rasiella rasia]QIE58929.1 PUR family DNA/RNA-binding protein [Rasiella rasia]